VGAGTVGMIEASTTRNPATISGLESVTKTLMLDMAQLDPANR
jgi:hypothetical protein